ncbi:MAG: response regulator [Synergistaceae bacterium]|jgi:putative two-component system response regulator|nr:response regulator [Synergistaceae bacterium]
MLRKKIILAVDDLPSNLTKVREILGGIYDVRLAKNAQMALSMMNRIDVDLVLLDIEMPGMSGFDFVDACRENESKRDIPVIFLTSHASEKFVLRAARAGAKDYIHQPFEPHTLMAKISAILSLRRPLINLSS